jgi:diadenosine tetraphosphate (Ap4A) HIT family hydrolase
MKQPAIESCLVCERIKAIQANTNPAFVCELETSYVVLGDSQFFKGYTLLLCKEHVTELHQLSSEKRARFIYEMAVVAEAVYTVFKPVKLNYELLGNPHPHLHWHIFPRYADDPMPNKPIWNVDEALRNATKLSAGDLIELKDLLSREILKLS